MLKNLIPSILRTRLHKFKMRLAGRNFEPYTIRRDFGSRECTIHIADPMGKDWYDRPPSPNPTDSIEITLLRASKLVPGARVFDLGAHQSVVAMKLACIVGSTGQVISVEANPHNVRIGRQNREVNQLTNIEVVHAAVSDKPGEINFSGDWGDQRVGSGSVKVKAVTIDDLTRTYGNPDVLYIDVEGFEYKALLGAKETLRLFPDLFIEMHAGIGLEDFGGSVSAVCDLLSNDYDLVVVQPCSESTAEFAVAFDDDLPWLNKRFYLVAKRKAESKATTSVVG